MNLAAHVALTHADPFVPVDYYHRNEIGRAMHRARRDITEAANLPATGTVDALNLLINATLHYLGGTGTETLVSVVEAQYEVDEDQLDDGQSPLDLVLSWIRSS